VRVWVVSELYFPEQTSTGYFLTPVAQELARELDVAALDAAARITAEWFLAKE
jgi:hypothetical protein